MLGELEAVRARELGGKLKIKKKNLLQLHFVHCKYHIWICA
jgi:hypothetical protein